MVSVTSCSSEGVGPLVLLLWAQALVKSCENVLRAPVRGQKLRKCVGCEHLFAICDQIRGVLSSPELEFRVLMPKWQMRQHIFVIISRKFQKRTHFRTFLPQGSHSSQGIREGAAFLAAPRLSVPFTPPMLFICRHTRRERRPRGVVSFACSQNP